MWQMSLAVIDWFLNTCRRGFMNHVNVIVFFYSKGLQPQTETLNGLSIVAHSEFFAKNRVSGKYGEIR